MTDFKSLSVEETDAMASYGANAISGAAKLFMEEAKNRNFDTPDAILLFCSVLITKAVAVIRLMVPGEQSKAIVIEMVEQVWNEAIDVNKN